MDEKNRHIDKILLSKSYEELTAEEFLVIKDEISSESEYNDLRAMLMASVREINAAQDIEPRATTKSFLMKEFGKVHPATRTNAGTGGLGFLFPRDKAFYQKPGYQLIAIAAVVILIITIFPKITGDISNKGEIAQHNVEEPTTTKKDDVNKPKEDVKKQLDETVEKDLANQQEQTTDQMIATGNKEQKETSSPLVVQDEEVLKDKVADVKNIDHIAQLEEEVAAPAMEAPAEDAYVTDELSDFTQETTVVAGSNTVTTNDSSSDLDDYYDYNMNNSAGETGGAELAVVEESAEVDQVMSKTEVVAKSPSKERSNAKLDTPVPAVKKVKTLAENAELIDLFYTAM